MISIYEHINIIYGYLHGLWRYRWSALFVVWLTVIAGWIAVFALPDEFEASTVVHIDTSSIMTPLLEGLAVESDPQEELSVMTRILLSRENLLAVIRETDMDLETQNEIEKQELINKVAKEIKLSNTSSRRGPANIYEISYTSDSAERAFKVVSVLLNSLIENTLGSTRSDTILAEEFLNEQIREYEQQLAAGESRLAEFKKKNVGFMPDEKGDFFARIRNAQQEIDVTKSALVQARQRYAELRKQLSGETPTMGVSNDKLRSYREQLVDLLTQYTQGHPDVKALQSKIADLEGGGTGGANGNLETESEYNPVYQELKVQESQARIEVGRLQIELAEKQKKLNQLQQSIDIIPQVEADLAKLNRDYDITRARYQSLVERRESARLAQSVGKTNSAITFRIIEAPVVPLVPAGPNRPLLLVGVMLLSLVLGLGWCLLRFLLYPTFVDYKQLKKMINLPVLGSVSLQIGPELRHSRRLHLVTFLMALLLLFGAMGGVLFYQQQGATHVRAIIADISRSL